MYPKNHITVANPFECKSRNILYVSHNSFLLVKLVKDILRKHANLRNPDRHRPNN